MRRDLKGVPKRTGLEGIYLALLKSGAEHSHNDNIINATCKDKGMESKPSKEGYRNY